MEFDLKIFVDIIPEYSGSPEQLHDFLAAAEAYNELLKDNEKTQYLKALISFKLKKNQQLLDSLC